MPVVPFVATGTACGRLRSPACAQSPSFPPILLPTRFMQEDGLPGTTPDSLCCRSPGKMAKTDTALCQRGLRPAQKNAEGTLPSAFFCAGHPFKRTHCVRNTRHTHQKHEEEGTMPSSSCRPGPRAVVRSPPSSGGDQRPHLKKVFWKGVRGRTFCPQKVSPASLPSSHTIAAQRRCCPCRSCRRAG